MKTLLQDIRYALRQLGKNLSFTLTAIFSLACGIAATTAVFSVVWAVLMNPYPYANPNRMVHVNLHGDKPGEDNGFGITGTQWQQFRHAPGIEDAIVTDGWNLTITGQDIPEDVQASYMSSNAFEFFGVPVELGRGLLPSDALDGSDPQPVAVLGYKFWKRHYNSDPSILGKTIQMVRKPYTVIGVAGPRFTWNDTDVYVPLKITADPVHSYNVEARLKSGVTHAMADEQLQPMITQFAKDSPKHFPPHPGKVHVQGLNDRFLQEIGGTLALLFGSVALLLAIGCGNVSILLLARGTARQHEFAVRAAIGASRWRIVRQLLTESLTLSVTGAALGVLLAYKLIQIIVSLLPENSFPHEAVITLNLPVLVFSVCVALVTGVLFGLSPALRLSRPDVREAMQTGTRKVAGTASSKTVSNILIAGQITLTLLMMGGAGAAIQGFLKLTHVPLGYNPNNVLSVGIPVHENTHGTMEDRTAYFHNLLTKVGETPGIRMAAISTNATPPSNGNTTEIEVLGAPAIAGQKTRANMVSTGYFPLLQIPLDRGRLWTEAEELHAGKVVVVNETLARKYFPNSDAVGHSIKIPEMKSEAPFFLVADGADGWLQIVGVVADKLNDGLNKPVLPEFFMPYTLAERMNTQVLIKTDGPPAALLHAVGMQVRSVDADQQIGGHLLDLEHWISGQTEYQQGQLVSWLFGAFAALALLLAAVGLYSVVSYTVLQRTNEFGIRMALGALRGNVLGLVFRSTAVSVVSGLTIGLFLSLLLRRVLAHVINGTDTNITTGFGALALAFLILTIVAIFASGIPARRATQIEPMEALRYE